MSLLPTQLLLFHLRYPRLEQDFYCAKTGCEKPPGSLLRLYKHAIRSETLFSPLLSVITPTCQLRENKTFWNTNLPNAKYFYTVHYIRYNIRIFGAGKQGRWLRNESLLQCIRFLLRPLLLLKHSLQPLQNKIDLHNDDRRTDGRTDGRTAPFLPFLYVHGRQGIWSSLNLSCIISWHNS